MGMRARFLDRLALEQIRESAPAEELVFQRVLPSAREKRPSTLSRAPNRSSRGIFSWRSLAAIAACALLGLSGFYLGKREWRTENSTAVSKVSAPAVPVAPVSDDRIHQLEEQKASFAAELALVKRQLALAVADEESLQRQLRETSEKVSEQKQLPLETTEGRSDNQEIRVQVALLESDLERLKQKLRDAEERLAVQQQMTLQVTEKLQLTESDLVHERDLKSAKDEMGDLVGSRNLHIVDVYDADSSGKQQAAFGRVFYVENKSLVFYAYDLDRPRQFKANVVFHVWGGKAGVKEVTHSLGILHKDDVGKNRWAMTFDDAKVLAQINSVFVTAEAPSKSYDSPRGRKVLYAYFGGQPNHP